MTTFFLPILLLLTIVAAFAFGVAAAYWVICGFLKVLNRGRTGKPQVASPALASPAVGD